MFCPPLKKRESSPCLNPPSLNSQLSQAETFSKSSTAYRYSGNTTIENASRPYDPSIHSPTVAIHPLETNPPTARLSTSRNHPIVIREAPPYATQVQPFHPPSTLETHSPRRRPFNGKTPCTHLPRRKPLDGKTLNSATLNKPSKTIVIMEIAPSTTQVQPLLSAYNGNSTSTRRTHPHLNSSNG